MPAFSAPGDHFKRLGKFAEFVGRIVENGRTPKGPVGSREYVSISPALGVSCEHSYAIAVRLTWPLTGRAEEMRVIEAAIVDPELSGIVICGAAGVGKSRIAREALSLAESKGRKPPWVVGTSSARQIPVGAFAEWAQPSVADNLELVRGIVERLTSASAGAAIVGVDDVHLLDDLSTFVLQQIVQRRAAKLVLTVRDGDPIPAGTQEIWRIGHFDRIDLQPLSQHETATLLTATLGGPMDPDAAHRMWTLTRGNVLYLRNIVEQEVADGRLGQRHGSWRWSGDPVVRSGLLEMVESRIGALPTSVSDVIDALAVSEPIELGALARITSAAAVEDAETRDLIALDRVEGRVEVRVAHPIYGEVRRARAPETRLRRLRGLIAAELARCDGGDDMRTVVRRAVLSLESDLDPDSDLLVTAARAALGLADLGLAERLSQAAIRAGGTAEAAFVRAFALSAFGRGEEADAALACIPESGFSWADRARVVFMRATIKFFTLADAAGAKKLIDDASQAIPSGAAHSSIDAFLAVYWAAMGRPEAAMDSSKNLVLDELPEFVGPVTTSAVVGAFGDVGRTSEAVAAADAGYAIVRRAFDAGHWRFAIAHGHVGALLQSGRAAEAWGVAQQLQEEAVELAGAALPYGDGVVGRAALGIGRLDAACALLNSVVRALSASGEAVGWRYRYQILYTIALAMRGATDEAIAELADLAKRRHPSWQCVDYERELASAWVGAAQGAVSEAITTALSAAEIARAKGQFAPEVICLQAAAQFGDGTIASRLHELAAVVEGPRAGLAARFADALHSDDGAELAAVSEEFERMGDLVAALDAAAYAARAYRRRNLRGSAYGCAARAEALAEQSGGASTPALRLVVEPLPLTAREREVVMLVGAGLSSRAVAERLTVSVRTVEGHIYQAMKKTGAASRDELIAMLPQRTHAPHPEGTFE
jgi:DNA-binding CsgD family transcriptional regulator